MRTPMIFTLAIVLSTALATLAAPSAGARTWTKERKIPASWGFQTNVYDSGQRCSSEYQLVISPVADAKSYRATYWDGYWKRVESKVGPPFEHLTGPITPLNRTQLRTATTWGVTGGTGPVPCATAADYEPRFPRAPSAWALLEYSDKPDTVYGRIETTGPSSRPVKGTVVRLTGPSGPQTTRTDANGAYSFTLDDHGSHRVSVTGPRMCVYDARAVFTNFPCTRTKVIDARGGERHIVSFNKLSGYQVSGTVYCLEGTRQDQMFGHPVDVQPFPTIKGMGVRVGYRTVKTDPSTGRFVAELEGGRTYRVYPTAAKNTAQYIDDVVPMQRMVTVADRDVTNVDFTFPLFSNCGPMLQYVALPPAPGA